MLGVVAALMLAVSAERPPDVVVILCDDLGYGDVSPLNPASRIPTPSFHRLAREGMTFTDAHTPSAVCTPTRYGLLTGRYAWRSRLKKGVLGGYSEPLIEEDRATIADVAKAAGYRTAAVGKWHLGLGWQTEDGGPPQNADSYKQGVEHGAIDFGQRVTGGPAALGFDTSFLVPASLDMPPYVYVRDGTAEELPTSAVESLPFPPFRRAGEASPSFAHVDTLDRIVKVARAEIAGAGDDPLLLYVPLTSPHKPVMPHPRFEGAGGLGPYSDFVVQTDAAVGAILAAVDEAGRAENTVVIVTSDNGSFMRRLDGDETDHADDESVAAYRAGTHLPNGPLRGTKADVWEAGHRVPLFVRWPGEAKAGSVCSATVCLTDVLPTVAAAAGAGVPDGAGEDGVSLMPAVRGEVFDRGATVHHSGSGMFAVREGRWKLVAGNGSGGRERPAGKPFGRPFLLFDLQSDLAETTDVASEHPEVVERLTQTLRRIAGDEVTL